MVDKPKRRPRITRPHHLQPVKAQLVASSRDNWSAITPAGFDVSVYAKGDKK